MKLSKMKKEELELLSYKDITVMILEEKGPMKTLDLFNKIAKLLDLPESTVEKKIGDYYTTLSTDKNFLLLENGKWDLRSKHTSDKVLKAPDTDDEEEEEEEIEEKVEMDEDEEDYDNQISDEDDFDDGDDDLKDLVVLDEEELELEQ
ncbi:MAG: DNA-directed RNA polymerase subunit delta [Bacilli bacterium]|nr:DNA-directed RNA polymerase subunit delta [Bacilli bacterium]